MWSPRPHRGCRSDAAPLAKIVLDKLSARYVHPVAGLVEGSDKALEHGSVEMGEAEGEVESVRMRIEGDVYKMLGKRHLH